MSPTKPKPHPDLSFEEKFWSRRLRCVGTDEVGRGCLAGPVVAASVVLPENLFETSEIFPNSPWAELNDSKLISPKKREVLYEFIIANADTKVAWCNPTEIDRYNILHASMIAMRKTLQPFSKKAQVVLVDGHLSPFAKMFARMPDEDVLAVQNFKEVVTIIKGDQKSVSIAAASIVAKVYRDRWMADFDVQYPGYDFKKHKGYSTAIHYKAIEKLGPCPIHRLSFSPFKEAQAPKARQAQRLQHSFEW